MASKKEDEELTAIFAEAGKQYGFEQVTARFKAMRDFSVKWTRLYKQADLDVSDYMRGCSAGTLSELARAVFARIEGERLPYSRAFIAEMSGPAFSAAHQASFVRRSLAKPIQTERFDEALARLYRNGHLSQDEYVRVQGVRFLTFAGRDHMMYHTSVLMRVCQFNRALATAPDEVLDYAVMTALAPILVGFDPNGKKQYERGEVASRVPRNGSVLLWLTRNCVYEED